MNRFIACSIFIFTLQGSMACSDIGSPPLAFYGNYIGSSIPLENEIWKNWKDVHGANYYGIDLPPNNSRVRSIYVSDNFTRFDLSSIPPNKRLFSLEETSYDGELVHLTFQLRHKNEKYIAKATLDGKLRSSLKLIEETQSFIQILSPFLLCTPGAMEVFCAKLSGN